jgi:alanine racemase
VSRPIQATVHLGALRHNYAVAKRTAARSSVLAVVKANAYGHGVERAHQALAGVVDGFAAIEIESAVRLRELGFEGPILLMEGFFGPRDLVAMSHYKLAFAVHNEENLALLETSGLRDLDVWFKVNTGMNRLGFPLASVRASLERLGASGAAKSVTLMTHFANADGPPGIDEAVQRFEHVTQGYRFPRSLANTAAIFGHPATHADTVRLGIGLYGATPFADRSAESLGLRPAMTLASELIALQDLQPGDCVGYGSTFRCERPMRIGVVACGYADGYPRHAPSGTPIMVGDSRTRTVGRVSMDMITVDLSTVPGAHVGTPVTLWGEGLPIDEVATAAGTVGYELMCGVMPRVPVLARE